MEEIITYFKRLGLTQYESAVLAALLSRHDSDAQQVAEIAGIPYTKIYVVLNSLEKLGLLKTTLERPKKYRPLSPEGIVNVLIQKRKQETEYLEARSNESLDMIQKLSRKGEGFEQNGPVIFLPTKEAVWDMVHQYIQTFKKNILNMGTIGQWEYIFNEKKIVENSNKYCKEKKTIKNILPNDFDLSKYIPRTTVSHLKFLMNPNIETRFYNFSKAQLNTLIFDEKEVMTGFTNPKTSELTGGIVVKDNTNTAGYIYYFNTLWKDSKPISDVILSQIKQKLRL